MRVGTFRPWNRFTRLEWRKMPGGGVSTYRGGRYCGPGWGFTRDDVVSGRIRELPAAIDAIDAACRSHDQCYADRGYFTAECNRALASDLLEVILSKDSTAQQRIDAAIMAAIFEVESLTLDIAVGAYRELRWDMERLFYLLSMEDAIRRVADGRDR